MWILLFLLQKESQHMTSQCRTYPAFKSLIHCSRAKIATFLQKTYLNRLIVINISQFQFKFRLRNWLSLVHSMIIQCWFGLRLCSEQASHCLNQRWLTLLTPICVSRPECIKAIMKIVFTNYILRLKQHNLHKINTLTLQSIIHYFHTNFDLLIITH